MQDVPEENNPAPQQEVADGPVVFAKQVVVQAGHSTEQFGLDKHGIKHPLQVGANATLLIQLGHGPVELQLQFYEVLLHNYISLLHN